MIAVSVKPCIVMCILPDAGAISTSAEFLLGFEISGKIREDSPGNWSSGASGSVSHLISIRF